MFVQIRSELRSTPFQVQLFFFSWADLKDMMRQAGEVTYTDAHQRMVSLLDYVTRLDTRPVLHRMFRVKIEAKFVLLIEKHFMPPKRDLMVKNATV